MAKSHGGKPISVQSVEWAEALVCTRSVQPLTDLLLLPSSLSSLGFQASEHSAMLWNCWHSGDRWAIRQIHRHQSMNPTWPGSSCSRPSVLPRHGALWSQSPYPSNSRENRDLLRYRSYDISIFSLSSLSCPLPQFQKDNLALRGQR